MLGSLLDYLISQAFEYIETLDPSAKHRAYRRCKLCGGTDERRDHYKPSIALVEHTESCTLGQHGEQLRKLVFDAEAKAA